MSRKNLTRNAASALLQVLATGAVTFELYRFLNRHLTVAQIGIWSVVLASAATGRLIDLGLGGGVVKFVAKYMGAGSRAQAGTTIQMAFAGMAVLFGLVSLLLYPLLRSGLALLIKDLSSLEEARVLLPYALCTLILGALSGVTLSAIDGCQRMDLRAIVSVTGSFVQLGCAYFLVPQLGLLGLAIGQVIQSMVVLGVGLMLLLRLVGPDLYMLTRWRKSTFFELIRYGSGFQAAAFGQILFEPAVKAILTRYSGLEFTGYYEMANRMILQLRNVLVSAYQSLVPYVASASKSKQEIRSIYFSSYQFLFFILALCVGLAGLLLPFVIQFWLGRFVPRFLEIGELSLLGWALNTLNVPAYFIFLGTGELRWPVISHTVIGILAAGFGMLFGHFYGGFGVLGAVTVALVFGSHIVTYAFHRLNHIPLTWLLPPESRLTAFCAVLGSVIVLSLELFTRNETHIPTIVVIPVLAVTLIYLSLKNPNMKVLMKLIGELRGSRNDGAVNPS